MGVAPYMVASSIVGVIAQRLVKVLCQECAQEVEINDPADLRLVNKAEPVKIKAAKSGGCKSCRNTGYAGRSAIHEIIIPSNAIKECISKNGTAEEIGQLAKANGTKLLRDNVTDMVLEGTTTMDELVKATYTV
jgi:type IV pilus assembly protein PilB